MIIYYDVGDLFQNSRTIQHAKIQQCAMFIRDSSLHIKKILYAVWRMHWKRQRRVPHRKLLQKSKVLSRKQAQMEKYSRGCEVKSEC
jgi:hypothetical protein